MTLEEARIEIAAKTLWESTGHPDSTWDRALEGTRELYRNRMRKNVAAYMNTLTTEWAGDHKHADIELTDEDGEPFVSEEDAIDNFADYPNTTVVSRKVTPWTPVDVTL